MRKGAKMHVHMHVCFQKFWFLIILLPTNAQNNPCRRIWYLTSHGVKPVNWRMGAEAARALEKNRNALNSSLAWMKTWINDKQAGRKKTLTPQQYLGISFESKQPAYLQKKIFNASRLLCINKLQPRFLSRQGVVLLKCKAKGRRLQRMSS